MGGREGSDVLHPKAVILEGFFYCFPNYFALICLPLLCPHMVMASDLFEGNRIIVVKFASPFSHLPV